MSIQIAKNLKKGDILFECDYGSNIEFEVITDPIITEKVDGDITYSWEGLSSDGRTIDYMISTHYSHYGPKLYLEPQY